MKNLEVSLLSHASLLINADNIKILTDPWFFGTAFNDSWELSPKPDLDHIKVLISDIDIIWISHEHPDHLHFPTLKWLFHNLNKKVTVYFQKTNSMKVFQALSKIGYEKFIEMPHMKKLSITSNLKLVCYAHRHLDSSLGVFINDYFWLLNINDTELSEKDNFLILKKLGSPNTIYNQFSIAGSNGIKNDLKSERIDVLNKMVDHHKQLNAQLTIPFASFINFARFDNTHLNSFSNTPFDAQKKFDSEKIKICLQAYDVGPLEWSNPDRLPLNLENINKRSINSFQKNLTIQNDDFIYISEQKEDVKKIIEDRLNSWHSVTSSIFWYFLNLGKLKFQITDWNNEIWECDFKKRTFLYCNSADDADIFIASQPLTNAFKLPFGIQTLGVSGRYKFNSNYLEVPSTWKKVRIISSLYNADIFFSFKSLFSIKILKWAWTRREGIINQVLQQIKRFKTS